MRKVFILFFCAVAVCSVFLFADEDKPLADGVKIDKIVIFKKQREMRVFQNGVYLKAYKVALGPDPVGAKQCQGDGKTPEGVYKIDGKNPNSLYHKNLSVSYPNEQDKKNALTKCGNKNAGGDIKIHGIGKKYGFLGKLAAQSDWTLGCIAVSNEEIDEIYQHTPVGARVEIYAGIMESK